MKTAFIMHKGKKISFKVPSEWKLLTFASFTERPQVLDIKELAKVALRNPIQSSALEERLTPSDKIAVLVEDNTRASPKRIILETLLEVLEQIHIPKQNISVIISLGTHRGLTSEELLNTFGRKLLDRYEFTNHDCRAPDLVPVGRLRTGREVKINRKVYEATFKIGIGSIFPHPMNGFGGGGKILFPGVADFDSILEHHYKYTFHEGTRLGKIKENLFYEEVCAIAQMAKIDYIINSILDQNDQVFKVLSGDTKHTHLAGIEQCKGKISQRFFKKSDLTLITSFPYTEGPQIFKPLVPASMVTKEKGCIILAADCTGNLDDSFVESFEKFHSKYKGNLFGGVIEHFENNYSIMEGGTIDFNMALGLTLAVQQKFKIIMLSGNISKEKSEKMGFIYAEDLEHAFELSTDNIPHPEVHIIPSGGVILPIL